MNDDHTTTLVGADGQRFVRLLDGATTDEELDAIITTSVSESMADLAEQLDDDPDLTAAERTSFLAKARPMAEEITRRNLYRMRARVQH